MPEPRKLSYRRLTSRLPKTPFLSVVIVLVSAALVALCAVVVPSVLGRFWWMIFAAAGSLVVFPWFARDPASWLFALLVLSLPLSARFRFGSLDLHPGGAEAAIAPIDFPLVALLILYLLNDLKTGKLTLYRGTIESRLLLFGLVGSLSIVNAAYPAFVVYEVVRIAKIILIIYCTKRFVRTYREVNTVLYLLVFSVVTQSILGLLQLTLGRSLGLFILGESDLLWRDTIVEGTIDRIGGTLGHANSLAFFLEMLLPITLSLAITRRISAHKRTLLLITFALGTSALVFTFSRAGWASLVAAAVLVFAFHFRNLRISVRQAVVIGLAGVGSLIGLVALGEPIYHRLVASSPASFTFRRNLIIIALNMWRDYPWLGAGLNNFTLVMARYDPVGLTQRHLSPVHNIYFLTAAETGVLGVVVFLWLLVGVFFEGLQTLRSGDSFLVSCAIGIIAGLVATLIHSSLGWLWRYDVIYTTFWFLVGYMLCIKRLLAQDSHFAPN